jgi:uncharacterized protein YbgA (DUF1722 family)/uncharacterized protein YbbK (DUF523 family)
MKLKIAVSHCLLGENCTYAASHNKDDFVLHELSKFVEFIPFCPETIMLGTPRETIRLVKIDGVECVMGNTTGKDYTKELATISLKSVEDIMEQEGVCGFIFKAKSPSCGIERVKLYSPKNNLEPYSTAGVMAKIVLQNYPLLPIEDNNRLIDAWLRENFVMQIFAYFDFLQFKKTASKINDLVLFHTGYKFLVMSKSTKAYNELGKIVANREKLPFVELLNNYETAFFQTLKLKNSRKKSFNALQHMYGFVKDFVDENEKNAILEQFEDFRNGTIPIISLVSMLELFAKKYECFYLLNQKLLNPYPKELRLRSDIKAFK